MKILFQGDSITDGGRMRGTDKNHDMGQGYAYLISALLGCGHPEKAFHFVNTGVSGNTVADVYARWQVDSLSLKPDFISLMVGTNDAGQAVRQEDQTVVCYRFDVTLRLLLEQTAVLLPRTKLLLIEPFMLDSGNFEPEFFAQRKAYLERIQGDLRKIAGEFSVDYLPMQERFDKAAKRCPADYWMWDSIHPTYAGHGLIANAWMELFKGIYL